MKEFAKNRLTPIHILLVILSIACLCVLILSHIFPKYTYKSLEYHVLMADDENSKPLSLEPGNIASFTIDTGSSGINGIQPCFYWGSDERPDGTIVIDAYDADLYPNDGCYLGQARTTLATDLATAYSYAEFSYETAFKGNLRFEIRYESGSNPALYPFLMTTDKQGKGELTYDGVSMQGDLLMYFVRIVKTYPLIFDARMVLLISLALLCIIPGKKEAKPDKPLQKGFGIELPFFIVSMALGLLLIYLTGTNQISYDEQTHFYKTWNQSFIGTVYDTDAAIQAKTLTIPVFHTAEERAQIEEALNASNDYSTAPFFGQTKFISYEKRAYLPNALFMAIGRLFGMPFSVQFMFSKIGNLLMYCLVCAFAIRLSKKGKAIICAVSMLPIGLFTATQFSYDPMVNCFLILYGSALMNTLLEGSEAKAAGGTKPLLRTSQVALMLICLVIGSYCKLVYALLALPLLFLSSSRFYNKKRAWIFRIVIVLLMAFLLLEILSPSYGGSGMADRIANAGDDRVEGTSAVGQLSYILGNPISYIGLLLGSIGERFISWFNGCYAFINFGYMGSAPLWCSLIWFAVFIFASLFSPRTLARKPLCRKHYIVNLAVIFVMLCVIWTVLYMSFNPVGNSFIGGVQDRYFIPLFTLAGMCFLNGKLSLKISEKLFDGIVLSVCSLLSLYCIITMAWLPYYC